MLQYMFGMTRMGLDFTPTTALLPFLVLFVLLFLASFRRIGLETEKQAVTANGQSLARLGVIT